MANVMAVVKVGVIVFSRRVIAVVVGTDTVIRAIPPFMTRWVIMDGMMLSKYNVIMQRPTLKKKGNMRPTNPDRPQVFT